MPLPRGQRAFQVCAGCHALDAERSAPSIRELQRLYAGKAAEIVKWAKAPGRKRKNFAPMPPFGHLPESDLRAAADYLLEMGQETAGKAPEAAAAEAASTKPASVKPDMGSARGT